nr:hypothetical protein [Paenibacillus graminis]
MSVKSSTPVLEARGIDRREVQRQIFDCVLEQIFFQGHFSCRSPSGQCLHPQ